MDEFLQLASVLNWFAALALGRSPRGIRDFSAFCIRYEAQTYGYMLS